MIQDIVFILIVLFALVRGLYRFFQWAVRGLTKQAGAGRTMTPQPMTPQQRPSFQSAPSQPRADLRPPPARRPDAGGPAVARDATTAQFRAQEEQLQRAEERAYASPQMSASPTPEPADLKLFTTADDLVRAFILQEALGPPLSRRPRR